MVKIKAVDYIFIPVKDKDEANHVINEVRQDHHDATLVETPFGLRIRYRDWF